MEHHGEYKWDFAQIQLNYVDWRHAKEVNKRNLDAQYLYAELSKRNIPAVVMEPLLGGRLAKFNFTLAERLTPLDPEASLARWAMRFAGSPPGVLTVLSGMTYREHLYENTATYSPLKPVTDAEKVALEEAAQALLADKTVPCNTCDYCMPCPYGLDIPGIFTVYNRALAEKRLPDDPTAPDYRARRKAFLIDYENAVAPLRRADHCTGCGRCSPHCPQSIDIPREIRRVDEFVEGLKRDA